MENKEIFSVGIDMIYLAACSLHGRLPEKARLEKIDLDEVYKMAKRHSMQSIIYIIVAKCVKEYGEDIIHTQLLLRWKQDHHATLARLVSFDIEREQLLDFLDKNRIWYLCLKGIVLQRYYPTLGMRQMTDNDILVDRAGCKRIREYMTERGFETYSYGTHCHDTYIKGGVTFEIHRTLAEDGGKTKDAFSYYKNVKDKLLPGKRAAELQFCDEDFYIYYIFHAYKHYSIAGCGVRTLMDIYAFLSKKDDGLDREYLNAELAALGLTEYERRSRELAFALFSADATEQSADILALDNELTQMLNYYLHSGTFGTKKQQIENSVSEISRGGDVTAFTKLLYLIRRVFPGMDYYRNSLPRASKFLVTIPFLWFIRIFRGIGKGKSVAKEVKELKNIK